MVSLLKSTLAELKSLKIFPSKKLGQNFLIDENVINKLLVFSELKAGDNVVEIGPGLGSISAKILQSGAELFAVEYDKRPFDFLAEKFKEKSNFHVMHGDAVDFPIASLEKKEQSYKVISNLPYAISSAWAEAIFSCENLPSSINLIIQDETARRFFSKSGTAEFCPIAIFLRSVYSLERLEKVSAASFYPVPAVNSVMLSMRRKENFFVFKQETRQVIRRIFTKRRKQIGGMANNEISCLSGWLDAENIDKKLRPEAIEIHQWQALDKFFC